MQEAPLLRPGLRLVPDDVERLARLGERALDQVVVVRRQDDELRLAPLAEQRRHAREQAVERARRVVGVEHGAEVPVQLPLAEHRVDVLRDAEEVGVARVRVPAPLRQRVRELAPARRERSPTPTALVRPVAEVRPGAEERDHLPSASSPATNAQWRSCAAFTRLRRRCGCGSPGSWKPRLQHGPRPGACEDGAVIEGKRVAVVVPAYNEEELLPETLAGIPGFVDRVIVVDDASIDGTVGRAHAAAAGDPRIVVVARERNGGVGAAIVTGYERALEEQVDVACVMAADNQMDPGRPRRDRRPRSPAARSTTRRRTASSPGRRGS